MLEKIASAFAEVLPTSEGHSQVIVGQSCDHTARRTSAQTQRRIKALQIFFKRIAEDRKIGPSTGTVCNRESTEKQDGTESNNVHAKNPESSAEATRKRTKRGRNSATAPSNGSLVRSNSHRLESKTEGFVKPVNTDAEAPRVQLQSTQVQSHANYFAVNPSQNQSADEDPPPDPVTKRLLARMSAAVTVEQRSIDFGHGLLLSPEEKEYMDRFVFAELSKIPIMPYIAPVVEGLLFAETFDREDVFDTWIVSKSSTHSGNHNILSNRKKYWPNAF